MSKDNNTQPSNQSNNNESTSKPKSIVWEVRDGGFNAQYKDYRLRVAISLAKDGYNYKITRYGITLQQGNLPDANMAMQRVEDLITSLKG